MTRRSPLRYLLAALGAAAIVSCVDNGPAAPTYFTKPGLVLGNNTFVDLSLGTYHSCGRKDDGEVLCWGTNNEGQSGNGVPGGTGVTIPRAVLGGFLFSSISAGGAHTCGILVSGPTMCWGNNVGGQLGVGAGTDKFEPTPVSGEHQFVQVSSSTVAHTCGLDVNGDVWCWGQGLYGRLGDGTEANRNVPTLVGGGIKFTSISAGGGHTCGIAVDSSAYCWGLNARGQVGDGTNDNSLIPAKVATTQKFIMIAAGLSHTCALNTVGDPYCWGDNIFGSLGDGTTDPRSTPGLVDGGVNFVQIVSGQRHSCGIDAAGIAMCWGYNQAGGLGDGTSIDRLSPVLVSTTVVFKKLAAGGYFTCGITTSNLSYCWGDNYAFQLGIDDSGQP